MAKPTKKQLEAEAAERQAMLREIVLMTKNNQDTFVPPSAKPLLDEGLIMVNTEITDEHGNVAARATQKGIDAVNTNTVAAAVPAPVAESTRPVFKLVSGVPIPAAKSNPGRNELYPWEDLAAGKIGDCFFVAVTEKQPTPWKALAGSVSSANGRFCKAEVCEEKAARFQVFEIPAALGAQYGYPDTAGAAVYRVEYKDPVSRPRKEKTAPAAPAEIQPAA